MEQLIAEGIAVCLVGDKVMENCVEDGVTGLTPAAREKIISRYGESVNVYEAA